MTARLEPIIIAALFVLMKFGLGDLLHVHYFVQAGDSAAVVDLVARAASGHGLVSTAFNSPYSIFPIIGVDADTFCLSDFPALFRHVSGLRWHAYLITFPMAALTFIPGVTALDAVVGSMVASFMGSVLLLWVLLRRRGIPVVVIVSFLILLLMFKPWSNAIMGQFYFDRLFLLPGIALVICVRNRLAGEQVPFAWIVALTIICALVSERPAVMVGCFLIAYPLLCRGIRALRSRDCWWMVALGAACWIYVLFYVLRIQDSPYKDVASIGAAIAALKSALLPDGAYHPHTMKLFAVLLPMFLLAAFDWRLCLVAAGAVVPNLLLSIGGAEKNNFFTHYHMTYLPFLISAAAFGLVRIWSMPWFRALPRMSLWTRAAATGAFAALFVLMAVYSDRISVGDLSRTFVFNDPGERALPISLALKWPNPLRDDWAAQGRVFRGIVSDIPGNSAVSSPEWLMPVLVQRKTMELDFAPIGLGEDRYMIFLYKPSADGGFQLDVPSFRAEDEVIKIRACIQARVDRFYNVMEQREYRGVRYRIYALKP